MRNNKFKILTVALIMCFMATLAYCGTDQGQLGSSWIVNSDGDIIPDADAAQDLGSSSYAVDNIYTDSLTIGETLAVTGITTLSEALSMGSEAVTTTAADPGLGTASIAKLVTLVTTDDTGTDADIVSLAAGDAGQMKIVKLVADTEATGMALAADYGGASASILFETVDDLVILVSDGTEWHILLNTGGTVS